MASGRSRNRSVEALPCGPADSQRGPWRHSERSDQLCTPVPRQLVKSSASQYAPFHTKVINVGVRDATYVLDGLLHHESDLQIEEHYTDTSGFTDHVFAMMHLLGFRFAPRIRDLPE